MLWQDCECVHCHAMIQKILPEEVQPWQHFFVKGESIQIALKVDHHRPVMAFRWQADDGPTLKAGLLTLLIFHGIRTSIAKEPYIFVILQGWGSWPLPPPPLDPRMTVYECDSNYLLLTGSSMIISQEKQPLYTGDSLMQTIACCGISSGSTMVFRERNTYMLHYSWNFSKQVISFAV